MPLRIALCGLGTAAERAHLPALTPFTATGQAVIVGISDLSAPRRQRAAELLPDALVVADHTALLDATLPDLLIVATPPSAHMAAIEAAMERDLHVVCEKPLGLSAEDCNRLQHLHQRHPNLALATVHQYAHAPAWQSLARMASAAVHHDETWGMRISVERSGTDPLSADGWRSSPGAEGGILGDHAVHYLALCSKLAPKVSIVDCSHDGCSGHETAHVQLAAGHGRIDIDVSCAGEVRRNRIRLERPEKRLDLTWEDDMLGVSRSKRPGSCRKVGSLSDRDFVNSLYTPFYRDVIRNLGSDDWRQTRCEETLQVARMLSLTLAGAHADATAESSWVGDLRALSRAVLLAFADLGIYLGSARNRLILKARSLDPLDPQQFVRFVDLCIEACLITPEAAGNLRLSPTEARRLALSLDGHTPVPEEQANAWADLLHQNVQLGAATT